MKSISVFLLTFVLFSCFSNTNNAINTTDCVLNKSVTEVDSLYRKTHLIHSVLIKNTSYQLYENLVCIVHDTTNNTISVDSYSTESLSIFQNGIFKKELFKSELFIERKYLGEALNEVYVSTISSDEEMTLLQIDFEFSPSAPGGHTISFIQFHEHHIKESRVYSILGEYITSNGEVDGVGWSGYFAYELPFKLTEMSDALNLDVDTLKIHRENDVYFLKIKDGVRFPPSVCELEMTIDPFGDQPLARMTVTLDPNKKVTLIYMAVDNLIQTDYYFKNWLKIKVADQEGWIEMDNDLEKIGCLAAG